MCVRVGGGGGGGGGGLEKGEGCQDNRRDNRSCFSLLDCRGPFNPFLYAFVFVLLPDILSSLKKIV